MALVEVGENKQWLRAAFNFITKPDEFFILLGFITTASHAADHLMGRLQKRLGFVKHSKVWMLVQTSLVWKWAGILIRSGFPASFPVLISFSQLWDGARRTIRVFWYHDLGWKCKHAKQWILVCVTSFSKLQNGSVLTVWTGSLLDRCYLLNGVTIALLMSKYTFVGVLIICRGCGAEERC